MIRDSGGAPEFSGLIRLMQRPKLEQRSKVAAAEEDEGDEARGKWKEPPPLFIRGGRYKACTGIEEAEIIMWLYGRLDFRDVH